jgi:hypothetical protein
MPMTHLSIRANWKQRPIFALALSMMVFAQVAGRAPAEPLASGIEKSAQPTSCATQPPEPALKLPGLTINAKERCVDIEATVCLDKGSLELIACTGKSKVHESVISVEARPAHIHTALLLLGARNGNPSMRRPLNEEKTRWVDIPPKGDLIDVFLEFKDASGKLVERPIGDFIARNKGAGGESGLGTPEAKETARFPTSFVFAGSQVRDNAEAPKAYLADISGHVISISSFGDELLCLPEFHSQDNGALTWRVDPTHLPKRDTKVTLRLRLKK